MVLYIAVIISLTYYFLDISLDSLLDVYHDFLQRTSPCYLQHCHRWREFCHNADWSCWSSRWSWVEEALVEFVVESMIKLTVGRLVVVICGC